MAITELERLKVANTCYAVVSGRLVDMLNAENRGRSFSWKDFPGDMAERCELELFIYLDMSEISDKKKYQLGKLAHEFALEIATGLVNRAGLVD